jgi:acyl dehydratase
MTSRLDTLREEIGMVLHSDWLLVDQSMIDRFAEVTLDQQFIHVDEIRAGNTPFGGTVAHGSLILSLLTRLFETTARKPIPDLLMGVNYGFDRVRFVNPVRSGSRIRGAFTHVAIEEKRAGQFQQRFEAVVEIEGVHKPAFVATWLSQFFVSSSC